MALVCFPLLSIPKTHGLIHRVGSRLNGFDGIADAV